jgi:hypothetical protein
MQSYPLKDKTKNKNMPNNSENVSSLSHHLGDLWGPFVLCLLLSTTLAFRTS